MDQELQFLINTLYGNRQLNDKQLQGLIKQWESDHNGFRDILRNQAQSKLPAAQSKGINPMLMQKQMNEAGFTTTPKLVSRSSSFKFDKNAGKAINDMSDIANFNDAFAAARKAGHKNFFWKKTKTNPSGMFSTALASDYEDVGDETLDVEVAEVPIDKSKINVTSLERQLFEPVVPEITGRQPLNNTYSYGYGRDLFSGKFAKGGTMNKVQYFAGGGQAQNQQADAFMQAVLQGDSDAIGQLIQAANQGDANATKLIETILQEDQKGNQQVAKAATVIKQLLNQTVSAKWGSKLTYIKSLKFAKGGKHTCPACEQKVEMKKCGGKKAKKHDNGGSFYINDEKNPMKMSDGTRMVGVIHKQGFKNATNRGMSQTLYDSTGRPVIQKDRTSNGGEREIYYNSVRTPIKRKGLFSPGHVMTNDTVYISGTPEMFENAPNMSTSEIKNRVYRFAQGMD